MPIKNPKQVFVLMLSDVRRGTEKTASIFQNLAQLAEDPDIEQALEVRPFFSQKVVETLDQCFKLIGEQPVPLSGTRTRIYDVLAEDFRNEVADIQDTKTRRFFTSLRNSTTLLISALPSTRRSSRRLTSLATLESPHFWKPASRISSRLLNGRSAGCAGSLKLRWRIKLQSREPHRHEPQEVRYWAIPQNSAPGQNAIIASCPARF